MSGNNVEIKISAKTDGDDDVKSLGSEIKNLSSDLEGLNKSLSLITSFKKLRAEVKNNKAQVKEAQETYKKYSDEIETSGKASEYTRKKYNEAKQTLKTLDNQYSENRHKLVGLVESLKKTGMATSALTAEEKRLKSEILETDKRLSVHTKSFNAYSTLGMKSFRDIRAEIAKQKKAYRSLAKTDIGWKEKAKAYSMMSKNIADLRHQTNGWTKNMQTTKAGLLQLTAAAYGFVSIGSSIQNVLKNSDQSAFNLSSSIAAANREFKNTGDAEYWKNTIQEVSGEMKIYSESALENAISRTIDMSKRLGISSDQMKTLIKRTGDLSAGKVDLEGGVERVTAALRGEAESAEYLGLTLNENYVKAQYEANKANKKAWKDLNDLEKAQARYNEFLKQTAANQGRAAEYANSYSGAIALVKKEIQDAVKNNEDIIASLNNLAVVLRENSDEIADFVSSFVSGIAKVIDGVVTLKKEYDALSPGMKDIVKLFGLGAAASLLFGGKIVAAGNAMETLVNATKDSLPSLKKHNKEVRAGTKALGAFAIAGVLAAGAMAWKEVFEQLGAIKGWRDAVDDAEKSAEHLYKTTDKVKKKYEEFKDIEIPSDFLRMPLDELKQFEKSLRRSSAYYVAWMTELETKSQETNFFGNMTDEARKAYEKLQEVKIRYGEIADAQKKAAAKIKAVEKEKTETIKKEAEKRKNATKEAAAAEQRVNEQMYKARKREEEKLTDLRSIEQQKQLAELDAAVLQELITVEEGNVKKAELEQKWAKERLKYTKDNFAYAKKAYGDHLKEYEAALEKTKEAYGEDSKEYKKALKEKQEAEEAYLDSLKTYKQAEVDMMKADQKAVESKKNLKETKEKDSEATEENTKKTEENTRETKKQAKEIDNSSSILAQYIRWVEKLTEKYADQKQTQEELSNSLSELLGKQSDAFAEMGNHPFILATEQAEESVRELIDAYDDVDQAAYRFGFRLDTINLSLSESKELIKELSGNFADFEQETADISQTINDVVSSVSDLSDETANSEIGVAQLKGEITSLNTAAEKLYKTKWVNADDMESAAQEVIDAYTQIRDQGIEKIEELKEEWDSLSDKIKSINEQILNIESDTQDKIRELRRKNMTDEEQWLDKRAEYNEKINAAMNAQNQGYHESAAELYKEAQAIAESLADEIQDESGNTIKSLEENTSLSIGLINQAADGMHSALSQQKNILSQQQHHIRNEINQTSGALSGLSGQLDQINKKASVIRTASDWDESKWSDFWADMKLDKYETGGYVSGPSHAQGGVKAELEGNEYVQPGKAVNHYGLGFMELVRQLKFPKLSDLKHTASLSIPKFKEGGWVRPQINIPALPKFKDGGLVSAKTAPAQGAVHTINLNLNGKSIGPLQGSKTTVETFINELQRAQGLT